MSNADVEQRIERGREAIALVRERGLDTSLWEKALKLLGIGG